SGFVMTLQRKKKVVVKTVMPNKDECEFVILVGSETGTTFDFATRFYNALTNSGKQVFMTELNNYSVYAKAKHLIILTATYGEGEPPTNARKFETLLKTVNQPNKIDFSVVGFGSLEYPNYCEFAIEVDSLLQNKNEFQPVLQLYKIDNSDFTDFQKWAKKWSDAVAIPLKIEAPKQKKKLKQFPFEVIQKTELNIDDTFLLRLKPKRKTKFTSGDLLSIFPPTSSTIRQYSIARLGNEVLLSIKKHEFGRASNYLYTLEKGDILQAAIEPNTSFHFPKNVDSAFLIANGTGIAPFLGMMDEHTNKRIQLLWGGRFSESFNIYENIFQSEKQQNNDLSIQKSLSREAAGEYVQHLVWQHRDAIVNLLRNRGVILICGSLTMQHGVLEVLEQVLVDSDIALDTLVKHGQLKMDCY